jgi:general secretion pathway protein B
MSFILDALRKSEHERHRTATPGLADVSIVRRESRLPVILGVVGALLIVNAVALALLLTRRPSVGAPHATTSISAAGETQAQIVAVPPAASAAPAGPAGPAGPAAPAAPVAPAAAIRPASSAAPAIAARDRAPPVRPLASETEEAASDPSLDLEPPPVASGATVRHVTQAGGIPSVDQLSPQATAGLPPLNLDLHVYTTDSASRFVMIGGHRYREGDALDSGPLVEQITPDGVVLNYRGNRFLLRHQ